MPYTPSEFDNCMVQAFGDGTIPEMGDYVILNGVQIKACVMDRSSTSQQVQGGQSVDVSGTVECLKSDYLSTGLTLAQKSNASIMMPITFSDGIVGRIRSVDDWGSLLVHINVGPLLEGARGPQGGRW